MSARQIQTGFYSITSGCSWAVFLLVRSRHFLLWSNILLPADGVAHPLHTVRYQEERRINLIESPLREMVTGTAWMVTGSWHMLWAAGQGQYRPHEQQRVLPQPVRLAWSLLCLLSSLAAPEMAVGDIRFLREA